jgi:diguanylate cyclase (GGDEF)-like protein
VDLSVLPTLYALTVFVCCFRPLVRRAGPHTNLWFAGWAFLLLHYLLFLLPDLPGLSGQVVSAAILWSIDLCALSFLWAASEARRSPFNRILVIELAVVMLFQSAVYGFEIKSFVMRLIPASMLLVPALHLLCVPKYRTRTLNHLGIGFAILAVCIATFVRADIFLLIGIVLGAVYLSTAYLSFMYAVRMTRGVGLMIGGLLLWALSCPLQSLGWLEPTAAAGRAIMDLPRYLLAAGMILSFLDDYVGLTERLALHDPLTGLPNRRLFENRLDAALEESRLTLTPVACLVIDVDNFKHINDTLGHPVGDGLLQALAKRLSWNLGPRDLLARTGGDEFTAVLVEAADDFHIRFIAGAMMAAGCVPVSIQEHSIDVRISIGIAVSPRDARDTTELHKAADDAMYRAKRRGGSIVSFAGEETPQIHAL